MRNTACRSVKFSKTHLTPPHTLQKKKKERNKGEGREEGRKRERKRKKEE